MRTTLAFNGLKEIVLALFPAEVIATKVVASANSVMQRAWFDHLWLGRIKMCSSGDRDTAVTYMRHYHSTIDPAINQVKYTISWNIWDKIFENGPGEICERQSSLGSFLNTLCPTFQGIYCCLNHSVHSEVLVDKKIPRFLSNLINKRP